MRCPMDSSEQRSRPIILASAIRRTAMCVGSAHCHARNDPDSWPSNASRKSRCLLRPSRRRVIPCFAACSISIRRVGSPIIFWSAGIGSSGILKVNAERVLRKLDIDATVVAADIGSVREVAADAQVILTSAEFVEAIRKREPE